MLQACSKHYRPNRLLVPGRVKADQAALSHLTGQRPLRAFSPGLISPIFNYTGIQTLSIWVISNHWRTFEAPDARIVVLGKPPAFNSIVRILCVERRIRKWSRGAWHQSSGAPSKNPFGRCWKSFYPEASDRLISLIRNPKPAGSRRRVFCATSGTFARFVSCVGSSGGTGKPAVA
jgi:hypothetical protein